MSLDAIISEYENAARSLDSYIADYDQRRQLAKSVSFSEEEVGEELQRQLGEEREAREPNPSAFNKDRDGFIQFTASDAMRRLLLDDPSRYEHLSVAFIQELPAGAVSPVEVGTWVGQVRAFGEAVAALPPARKQEMSKALRTQHATASPEPWRFEKSKEGLQAFTQSRVMQDLRGRDRAAHNHAVLDFAVGVRDLTPREIGALRQRLDRDSEGVVAKALSGQHDGLTYGQAIIKANFGFDPGEWCRG